MKTIKTILIALLFASFSTISNADVKGGITIMGLDAAANGEEMSRGNEQTVSEDIQGLIASFFLEKGFDTPVGSMAIGIDISPYDIADGSVTNARVAGASTQTNKADVSVSENYGAYVTMNLGDTGAYLKAMVTSHNMKVDSTASDSLKKQAGDFTEFTFGYGIQKDTRDRSFMPTTGSILGFTQELPLLAEDNSSVWSYYS